MKKAKPFKRKFITNSPFKQNVGKVNKRKAGKLIKPYGLQGRTSVAIP